MISSSLTRCGFAAKSCLAPDHKLLVRCAQTLIRTVPICHSKSSQASKMSTRSSEASRPADRTANLPTNFWTGMVDLTMKYAKVNLGQGMPDFDPPSYVKDALVEVAHSSNYSMQQYSRGQGHPRLVKAIAKLFSKLHGREIDPMNEIVVTVGAYESLYCTFMAFINPGEEVILIEPCFDCYKTQIKLAGGTPVNVPLQPKKGAISSKDWILDRSALESKVTDKTRAIVINTPHNPTGKVLSMDELEMIADICKKHDLLCISDEVYEWLVFDGVKHNRIATLPGMWERTVTISSGGKTFGITGWKVGWSIAPTDLIKYIQAVHTDVTFHVPTPLQEAVAMCIEKETPLLGTSESYFTQLAETTTRKMKRMAKFLSECGFTPVIPEGGYFMMADFSQVDTGVNLNDYDKTNDHIDFKFIRWLVKEKAIATVPPSAFYSPENKDKAGTNIRVCLMKSDETIQKAEEMFKEWRKGTK